MINSENIKYIYIQIIKLVCDKNYLRYELEDYLLRFNKYIVYRDINYIFCLLFLHESFKKIDDNKFSIISKRNDSYDMYIAIFDIHNFKDINLFIKYYIIKMTY